MYPGALLAFFSPVIRGKVQLTIRFSAEKRTKPGKPAAEMARDGSRLGRSQISKRRHNSSFQAVSFSLPLSTYLSIYLSPFPIFVFLFGLLTQTTNYNVTFRRRERRRCGRARAIYRGRHIAEIFSHRQQIWLPPPERRRRGISLRVKYGFERKLNEERPGSATANSEARRVARSLARSLALSSFRARSSRLGEVSRTAEAKCEFAGALGEK